MKKYLPNEIEPRWQKRWLSEKLFSPDINLAKKPYYSLMMFPYPSAEGLHVGNMYAFTGSDIYSRYQRMQGMDVFEPIGLDGFGIHSENYALKINKHPMGLSKVTERRFYEQLMMIGNAYDWHRRVETYKSNYYKWTQWLFLKMYRKALAYRAKAKVNWCPSCLTVLADEQVIAGKCERCATKVIKKELEQWFFKITKYADKLLNNLDNLDWSEKVKIAQRHWIGKSEGILVKFGDLEVFTTRPDTIFGATFLVINPEHPLVYKIITEVQKDDVERYIKVIKTKTEVQRKEAKEKTGVFTGSYVKNPLTQKNIPIWIADYVLIGYGTGAIMGVPAHDNRDFKFAKKYGLEIKQVIKPKDQKDENFLNKAYHGNGILINSGEFTGLESDVARLKISKYIESKNLGTPQVQYHLRDWLISRQRYWGPPIPIIYCDKCGTVAVPEEDLPVELPFVENFKPTGTGRSPLASDQTFVNVKCPNCDRNAKRETDVSDTFLDSSWYFLRYPSTDIQNKPFDIDRSRKWLPVGMYIGGAEHSVLHLLYSRFITMVLHEMGYLDFEEPFQKFRAHGLLIKEGAKISKSKGNIVNPDQYIEEYGADTLRVYLMFMGPFSQGGDFRDAAINGVYKFMQRIWNLFDKVSDVARNNDQDLAFMHQTIKNLTIDTPELNYNTAIASLMEWLNHLSRKEIVSKEEYKTFLKLLAPFAPFITEELWHLMGEKETIHLTSWPKYDERYLEKDKLTIVVQVNGKVRDILEIDKSQINNQSKIETFAKASKKIQKFTDGKSIKRLIYIPGKIINFLV